MIKSELQLRLRQLKAELQNATCVAVSKYSPVEDVVLAYECGQMDFGENRVLDLKSKADFFKEKNLNDVRWHMIGHLQTNKAKEVLKVPNLWAIHSVDSLHLLEELVKREHEFKGQELKIFFQVNTSHEDEKSGFLTREELVEALTFLLSRKESKLKVYGLMTMGAIRTDDVAASALKSFRELRGLKNELDLKYSLDLKLSMGMSGDYKQALLEGADYIRVGSLIFK